MPTKYRFKRKDRASVPVGAVEFCYQYSSHTYGCTAEDERLTGLEHTGVTFEPDGGTPFFTIPKEDLEVVQQ